MLFSFHTSARETFPVVFYLAFGVLRSGPQAPLAHSSDQLYGTR